MLWRAIKTVAVTISLCLLTIVGGCGHKKVEKLVVPVRVAAVELNAASTGAKYSATIIPRTQVELAFKVGGYVDALRKVRGVAGRQKRIRKRTQGNTVVEEPVAASDYGSPGFKRRPGKTHTR